MGLPLAISFIALIFIIVLGLVSNRYRRYKEKLDSLIGLLIGLGFVMWILAIAFKDPIIDYLSQDAQLIIAGLGFAGLSWKYYFDPMKRRILRLEVGQGEIKADISNIKSDIHWVRESITKKK